MRRATTAILVTALLIAGCGGDAAEETTLPPTTAPPTEVEVVKDLAYHSETEKLREALLDVYALPGAEGGPVVVLLHGDGRQKSSSPYPALAGALAELGAVAFVPDWQTGEPITSTTTRDDLLAMADGASCAVSYALAHAAEYGADPGRLVLFGHSAGANWASLVGLREAVPLPECAVPTAPFVVDGMVLWEGDWLISSAEPSDQYGNSLPLMMEGATPWSWLATGPRMAVDLVTTWGGRAAEYLCDVSDPEAPYWERDPDGWFRERLEASGALDDGCIDVGEPTRILADTMREQGFDVVELFLENSDHYHFSPDDQALVLAEVIAIADR